MDDNKLDKLPKYARDEIIALRRKVEELRLTIKQERTTEPTNIAWGYRHCPDDAYGYVPDGETVFFSLGGQPRDVIRVRRKNGALNINADGTLLIECYSSNDLLLSIKDI